MRFRIFILFLLGFLITNVLFAQKSNEIYNFVEQYKATGFVNDFAKVLSVDEKQLLENKVRLISDSSSIQFGICILKSLSGYDAKDLAETFGNFWGVGQKETNNGSLILLAIKERKIYISTGIGTAKYVSNDFVKALIANEITPQFKSSKYYDGLNAAINQLYALQKNTELDIRKTKTNQNTIMIFAFMMFLAIGIFLFFLFKKYKNEDELIAEES